MDVPSHGCGERYPLGRIQSGLQNRGTPIAYDPRGRCDGFAPPLNELQSPALHQRRGHDVLALPWGYQYCPCHLAR